MLLNIHTHILVKKFSEIFLPFSALVSVVLGVTYYKQIQTERIGLKVNELRKVEIQAKAIAGDFRSVVSDLFVLSGQEIFKEVHGEQQALTKEFLLLSQYKKLYDQIRFLDPTGKEIVRVNFKGGKPTIVPQDTLQVQVKRYWFQDTLRLNKGEVFVSPLDLNIERGKVEQPLKPMIRFGTPIFDSSGQKRGILVFNYLGQRLLDNFAQVYYNISSEEMLLNSSGYWLKGANQKDEWGFMFPERRNRTFGKAFPLAWQQISQKQSGQVQTPEGLFTFTTVYPLLEGQKSSSGSGKAFAPSQSQMDGKSYYWKIVSRVPPETLTAKSNKLLSDLWLLYIGLIGVIAIGSWWLAWSRVYREIAQTQLRQSQTRLLELAEWENKLKTLLSSQIRNSLDLNMILNTAVAEVRALLQIDRCQFLWYYPEDGSTRFKLSYEACNPQLLTPLGYYPLEKVEALNQAILENKVLRLDDIATDPQLDAISRELLLNVGLTSLLVVSLRTHSEQVGVMVFERVSHPWRDNEVELIQGVADQLAIAIDQAELYSQSRAATATANLQAEQLQKALHQLQQAQSQLIQNEKMSSLGQMVAGVAHEINNPVNFIHGNLVHASEYTQGLLRLVELYQQHYPNPVTEIQQEIEALDLEFLQQDFCVLLQSMNMGTQRIRDIVKSLRIFSRLDEADLKITNIHEGIDSTLMILNHRLNHKHERPSIAVLQDYGDLPLVECYAGQLNQVFMNILVNAIDALEERDKTLTLEEIKENPSGIYITTEFVECEKAVRIKIRDNGLGIPEAIKNRIFDPFFTTKPVGQGTGLGMSISYQIIAEKHQGSIWCISEPGQGSEFWIQIPIQQRGESSGFSLSTE